MITLIIDLSLLVFYVFFISMAFFIYKYKIFFKWKIIRHVQGRCGWRPHHWSACDASYDGLIVALWYHSISLVDPSIQDGACSQKPLVWRWQTFFFFCLFLFLPLDFYVRACIFSKHAFNLFFIQTCFLFFSLLFVWFEIVHGIVIFVF
jgi:hypothetical protein